MNVSDAAHASELAFSSALAQAHLIRTGELSPRELVEHYLDRIQRYDSQLGSFVSVCAEQALAEAEAKTAWLASERPATLPPFFGVPIAIKDLHAVAGLPCSLGVAALKGTIATYDEGGVSRIKQAGFIILGKTATSELGSFPYTEPPGFAPTRNPWHLDYTAGGSSGGSAAAVAAGLCPVAQGSDGGGSIRGPAHCCGIVGIKPSRGRITHAPLGDYLSGITIQGPLARTVADAAALLDVLAGYTLGDPYWLPDPEPSFLAQAQRAVETPIAPLRIAVSTTIPPIGEADPVCQQAVRSVATHLAAMGHHVEAGCPDFTAMIEPFIQVWQTGVVAAGVPVAALSPVNQWLFEQANARSAADYLNAVGKLQVAARQIVAFFSTVDVLILPVFRHPPIRVGEWADLAPDAVFDRIVNWVSPCPPWNATGQPAIALPTGLGANGVPTGVQLVGRPAAEATLIALAAQLEAWHYPPQRPSAFAEMMA